MYHHKFFKKCQKNATQSFSLYGNCRTSVFLMTTKKIPKSLKIAPKSFSITKRIIGEHNVVLDKLIQNFSVSRENFFQKCSKCLIFVSFF